jgi:predicted site-specific integrase-resolvase
MGEPTPPRDGWRQDTEERMLVVSDVARRLGLAPKTVRRYLRDRKILGVKTGTGPRGEWRVAEGEVERWQREGPANGR